MFVLAKRRTTSRKGVFLQRVTRTQKTFCNRDWVKVARRPVMPQALRPGALVCPSLLRCRHYPLPLAANAYQVPLQGQDRSSINIFLTVTIRFPWLRTRTRFRFRVRVKGEWWAKRGLAETRSPRTLGMSEFFFGLLCHRGRDLAKATARQQYGEHSQMSSSMSASSVGAEAAGCAPCKRDEPHTPRGAGPQGVWSKSTGGVE